MKVFWVLRWGVQAICEATAFKTAIAQEWSVSEEEVEQLVEVLIDYDCVDHDYNDNVITCDTLCG